MAETADALTTPCPHCGQPAEYPDCDICGAMLTPIETGGTEGTGGTSLNEQEKSGAPEAEGTGHQGHRPPLEPAAPDDTPPKHPREIEIARPGYRTHDDWFRVGKRNLPPGLYYHHEIDDEGNAKDTYIADPVHATAMTEDERGNNHGLLLRFPNARAEWREWAMPMRLLSGSGEELRGELLDQGFRFHRKRKEDLMGWLMSQRPRERLVAATRTGWHGDAFVLPHQTLGDQSVRFQSETVIHDDYASAGSLAEWQRRVAEPCRGNPVLMLAVSLAFTGPLLWTAKQDHAGGAGLHLMGDSSQGKTTALAAAASVWGGPGYVRTWRATANGLEATAAALNDTALILDEISEANPHDIGGIVYALANGCGKQRARRTGGSRPADQWRLMALSSGERTLAEHMAEGGRQAKAGQESRLLSIPATRETYGAFDTLHDHADGRAFADAIKHAAQQHYGHAGPAFIEALLADDRDMPEAYAGWLDRSEFQANDGQESRAACWFALVALAGELATDYGVVPWDKGEALGAAIWGYRAWRDHRGSGQTENRQILDGIRAFIERHGDSRFTRKTENAPVRERAGYIEDGDDGVVYLFNTAALSEAAGNYDTRRIVDALEAAGWLAEKESASKRRARRKINGQTMRFYAVRPDMEGDQ